MNQVADPPHTLNPCRGSEDGNPPCPQLLPDAPQAPSASILFEPASHILELLGISDPSGNRIAFTNE